MYVRRILLTKAWSSSFGGGGGSGAPGILPASGMPGGPGGAPGALPPRYGGGMPEGGMPGIGMPGGPTCAEGKGGASSWYGCPRMKTGILMSWLPDNDGIAGKPVGVAAPLALLVPPPGELGGVRKTPPAGAGGPGGKPDPPVCRLLGDPASLGAMPCFGSSIRAPGGGGAASLAEPCAVGIGGGAFEEEAEARS